MKFYLKLDADNSSYDAVIDDIKELLIQENIPVTEDDEGIYFDTDNLKNTSFEVQIAKNGAFVLKKQKNPSTKKDDTSLPRHLYTALVVNAFVKNSNSVVVHFIGRAVESCKCKFLPKKSDQEKAERARGKVGNNNLITSVFFDADDDLKKSDNKQNITIAIISAWQQYCQQTPVRISSFFSIFKPEDKIRAWNKLQAYAEAMQKRDPLVGEPFNEQDIKALKQGRSLTQLNEVLKQYKAELKSYTTNNDTDLVSALIKKLQKEVTVPAEINCVL